MTCVGLPSQTRATPEVSKGLETAAQVTEALDKGIVKIHNWIPGEDDSRFDILPYDVCVRASMLQDFFKVTPKDVIGNSNCDTQFCEFIMSGGLRGCAFGASAENVPETRSLFLRVPHWIFFARPAEYEYRYLTFLQLNCMHLSFKNVYQMVPFVFRIAEMKSCPCLSATADLTWASLLEEVTVDSEKAMLEYEYKRALKDKPWL